MSHEFTPRSRAKMVAFGIQLSVTRKIYIFIYIFIYIYIYIFRNKFTNKYTLLFIIVERIIMKE